MGYTTISFPGLGLEMNPPASFQLFGMEVRFYGVIIALGLLLAVLYALRRSKEFGLKEDDILDGVLGIVPFAIICARAYYCAFRWEDFAAEPISVLYIWQGGIAIYGGIIGAALGMVVLCLIKKIRLGALLDLVALGFLIGQSIGRWGNFFNREAFGCETDSFLRMGLSSVGGVVTYHHPTFLYESLWNLLGFVVLHFASKKRKYDGQIALCYVLWYGFGRTYIEGLRTDSLYWGDFRVSQLLAAVSCFTAAWVVTILMFKKHDPQKLYVNQMAKEDEEVQVEFVTLEEGQATPEGCYVNPEDKEAAVEEEPAAEEETAVEEETADQDTPVEEAVPGED